MSNAEENNRDSVIRPAVEVSAPEDGQLSQHERDKEAAIDALFAEEPDPVKRIKRHKIVGMRMREGDEPEEFDARGDGADAGFAGGADYADVDVSVGGYAGVDAAAGGYAGDDYAEDGYLDEGYVDADAGFVNYEDAGAPAGGLSIADDPDATEAFEGFGDEGVFGEDDFAAGTDDPDFAADDGAAADDDAADADGAADADDVASLEDAPSHEASQDAEGSAAASATPSKRKQAGGLHVDFGRVARVAAGVLLAALLALCVGFSCDRWLLRNDAADFQGTWYANNSNGTVTIDGQKIDLASDVSYDYTLDTFTKTVSFSFKDLYQGQAHYRFSADRSQLVITDGQSFSWWETFAMDAGASCVEFFNWVQGKSESPAAGNGVTVFNRNASSN